MWFFFRLIGNSEHPKYKPLTGNYSICCIQGRTIHHDSLIVRQAQIFFVLHNRVHCMYILVVRFNISTNSMDISDNDCSLLHTTRIIFKVMLFISTLFSIE